MARFSRSGSGSPTTSLGCAWRNAVQQCVEIEWTVVAPVTRHGSPLAFRLLGVSSACVRVRGRLDFFKCVEWRDDLVGVAETFKYLREELSRRA
jgi:hypothetical protein